MALRLRQVRKALKRRQAAFATILGVTPATYCKYERHTIPITAAQLARLSEATGVPIEDFYEKEPMASSTPVATSSPDFESGDSQGERACTHTRLSTAVCTAPDAASACWIRAPGVCCGAVSAAATGRLCDVTQALQAKAWPPPERESEP